VFLHHPHIVFSEHRNTQILLALGLQHFGTDDAMNNMWGVISKSMFLISQGGKQVPAKNQKNGEAKRWA
jgi:hypothetical protein